MEISGRSMTFSSYGHGATVAYGSPKPLIWVRILVPVLSEIWMVMIALIITFSHFHIFKIMNKVSTYFRESWKELIEKVTWPTWNQLQQSTVIVLVATLVITAMVWIMDFASQNLLKLIYSFFK